jgi:hypothetical protein
MIGYLSNFRIVDGVAVYTGAFTPSTSPLQKTQSSGTNISAITGSQTSLLTCQSNRFIDNSNGAIAITPSGTPLVQAFQPFSPAASYSAATYGGSGYFDGDGDYLTWTGTALGSGNFTIECWSYPLQLRTTAPYIDSNNGLLFRQDGANILVFDRTNSTYWSTTGNLCKLNAWNHIAVVRNSGTITVYINGVNGGSSSNSTNFTVTSYVMSAFFDSSVSPNAYYGYLSNFRIVVGTAIYTAAFTPPTLPVTAVSGTSLLTNFTNAGIYDAAWQNNALTVGDAQTIYLPLKLFNNAVRFDGTGDYLNVPSSSQLQLGSGDFTIEAWIYLNAISGSSTGAIVAKYTGGVVTTSEYLFQITTNGSIGIALDGAGAEDYFTSSASIFTTNTWYHVAVTKSGSGTNNVKIWQNGIQVAQGTSTRTLNSTSTALTIGSSGAGSYFNGYIQDLRITRGVARYTNNFVPPSADFKTR